MKKDNFDQFAESYDEILREQLKFFGEEHEYFSEYKIKIIKKYLDKTPNKILEYGCGIGRNLKYLRQEFHDAEIYACDISENSVEIAKKNNPSINVFRIDDNKVSQDFDLIFIAMVFHHVEVGERLNLLNSIYRLLSKKGSLFVFEHNPYNIVTRYLVNTCPFDGDAVLIKRREMESLISNANFNICLGRYTLYFPYFLRKLRFLESILGHVPLGGQYFIKAFK